ncbi:uncharacterized protein LOC134812200 isoform X2 [Bolinopsis microptera]|uniref:uncharacterized protein LOC134812200 isoform X2 n=1 Tax=Bolinopsis microptera TaxID=2820187 RepID=UPI00307AAA2A
MSTSVLKKLINSTAESNISMRKQIKEQQMSLSRLEHRMKQKKLGSTTQRQNQLRIPPGKMIIKAKGKMIMRVRNDKAILDELTNTKHRADSDDEMTDKSSPKFDSKTAPNLIIQSSVQNAPTATSVPPPHTAVQPPPHSHPPPPGYYQHPPPGYNPRPPIVLDRHYSHHQPVHYVEEYVHEPPPTVYKVRKPYPRSYPEPVIVYPNEPTSPHDHYQRSRPTEYKTSHYPSESWHSSHSPPPRHHNTSPRYKHSGPGHYQHREEPVLKEEDRSWNSASINHYVDTSRKRSYPSKESTDNVIRHDLTKRPTKNTQFRVLISNLHPSVTLQDIEELFSAIDTVEHIQMLYPGVAEVLYISEQSASVSVERYHNRDLDGQPMQISYSLVPVTKRESETGPTIRNIPPPQRPAVTTKPTKPATQNTSKHRNNRPEPQLKIKNSGKPEQKTSAIYRREQEFIPLTQSAPQPSYKRPKTRGRGPNRGVARGSHSSATPHSSRAPSHSSAVPHSSLPPVHSDTESSVHSFTVTM